MHSKVFSMRNVILRFLLLALVQLCVVRFLVSAADNDENLVVHKSSFPTYTILAPAKLRPNLNYHVIASVHNVIEPINVEVTLQRDDTADSDDQTQLTKSLVVPPFESRILNFEIADWPTGNYRLVVSGAGNVTFDNSVFVSSQNSKSNYGSGVFRDETRLAVTGTGEFSFHNEAPVTYDPKSFSMFIQTDKAIYKPGQKVQFRVVSVKPNLLPKDAPIDIYIEDANRNRIKQWNGLQKSNGIISRELLLSEEPVMGDWKITAQSGDNKVSKSFTVQEYVLPTFDVEIKLPSYTTINDSNIVAVVKATYTYGQPVRGQMTLVVKPIGYWFYNDDVNHTLVIQKPINGSATMEINLKRDLGLQRLNYDLTIQFVATVTEELTGRQYNKTGEIRMHDSPYKVELANSVQNFKPGLVFDAIIRVAYQDGTPVPDNGEPVEIVYNFSHEKSQTESLVPKSGIVKVRVYPPRLNYTQSYYLNWRANYRGKRYWLSNAQSAKSMSNNFIQLSIADEADGETKKRKVGDQITVVANGTENLSRVIYKVMGRGDILNTESFEVSCGCNRHEYQFELTQEMAPQTKVVVYYIRLENQEIVADAMNIEVDGVFQTPVAIKTNVTLTEAGEPVGVQVETKPNAHVSVLGIDQSILLLKSGNDLTQQDVINDLNSYETQSRYRRRKKRSYIWPWQPSSPTSEQLFSDSGLILLTNAAKEKKSHNDNVYFKHRVLDYALPAARASRPGIDQPERMDTELEAMSLPSGGQGFEPPKIKVRKEFPETWLWESKAADESGVADFSRTVPDTITSWIISALAMDESTGLGISPETSKVTVFRPFFLKFSLPYSIVRGETIALHLIVFNYQSEEIKAQVTLENNNDEFEFADPAENSLDPDTTESPKEAEPRQKRSVQVPSNDGVSVYFLIKPKKVCHILLKAKAVSTPDGSTQAGDAVEDRLLVKPEGQTVYINKAALIELKDDDEGKTIDKTFNMTVPEDAVPDSKKVSISLMGDIMGPAANNLDDLLRMPYGCGEQNMIKFVPNILVLNHLEAAGRLTDKAREKALNNIESGYQREMRYRRSDGSFSAFGQSDKNGSTWLTAFVVKSFNEAKQHIAVDDGVVDSAVKFLTRNQNPDGSFNEPGKVHDKHMAGGSVRQGNLSTALTSYIVIALASDPDTKEKYKNEIEKSAQLIEESIEKSDNKYEKIIGTYALQVAGKNPDITKLMVEAEKSQDFTWWKDDTIEDTEETKRYPWMKPKSNEIEMSAYGLLTLVAKNQNDDALPVLRWLISKQNSNGGFASTQDTVIGLAAMANFASSTTSNDALGLDIAYQLSPVEGDVPVDQKLRVSDENRLVLQKVELPESTDSVNVKASGQGSAIVQVSYQYNKDTPVDSDSFKLSAAAKKSDKNPRDVEIKVCTSFGSESSSESNMAVIEIEMPSGYVVDRDSLVNIPKVKRVDTENGDTKVVLYFDSIGQRQMCLKLNALKRFRVANLKPVSVRVYDYYDQTKTSTVFYSIDL